MPDPQTTPLERLSDANYIRDLKDPRWGVPEIKSMNERLEKIAKRLEDHLDAGI